jgi:hypothetical protein
MALKINVAAMKVARCDTETAGSNPGGFAFNAAVYTLPSAPLATPASPSAMSVR